MDSSCWRLCCSFLCELWRANAAHHWRDVVEQFFGKVRSTQKIVERNHVQVHGLVRKIQSS